TSMSERSVRPYLIVVSPRTSEVSRSPPAFCSDQSASPVSICQCPAGTVHAGVDLPGRSAQIGCSSAAAAALLAHSNIAAMMPRPRIALVCRRGGRPSSELEVTLPEPRDALVDSGRVQNARVELKRLADPAREGGMVGKIVVGQRVNQRAQARCLDCRNDGRERAFGKMDLELRNWMRPDRLVHHPPDERYLRVTREPVAQRRRGRALPGRT